MIEQLLNVYKPPGATPLAVITTLKAMYPEYKNVPIGYAGRLDPMAHGVLLLMIGEATKKRNIYLNLSKSYTFAVLLGFSTDTYDLLGLVQAESTSAASDVKLIVNSFVKSSLGKQRQSYPPYSSKTIQGKPLFWWAKDKKLHKIILPTREIEITYFSLLKIGKIKREVLNKQIKTEIARIKGDFRQEAILKRWDEVMNENKATEFTTLTFEIDCSSGTYIRGLVHKLGQLLGTGAIATDILRTRVGDYSLEDSLRLI